MFTHKFIRALLLLLTLPLSAQQSNGRSYVKPTTIVGNNMQWGSDNGVNGYMLISPFTTPNVPMKAWGLFHANEVVADATGTNHYGFALYDNSSPGVLLCSTYGTRTVVQGDNTYNISGCPAPVANTLYYLAYFTDSSSANPGNNNDAAISSHACPTSGGNFSLYVAITPPFPSTAPSTGYGTQSFCYTHWAEIILPGGSNGKYYQGPTYSQSIYSVPSGPWTNSGNWYGGLNAADTFVNFSDGLVNATYPTTTTLGNSSHGTAGCTSWSFGSTNQVIKGDTGGHANLLSPVVAGGVTYGGYAASPLTLVYLSGATRNYAICHLPSTYAVMSVGYHIKVDIPISDTEANQYDAGGVQSGDSVDQLSPTVVAGGASLNLVIQCEISGSGGNFANILPMLPNVDYWIWLYKPTGGATESMTMFKQSTGEFMGQVSCPSSTGTHNAGYFFTPINGAETNSTGNHMWVDTYEANITGVPLLP